MRNDDPEGEWGTGEKRSWFDWFSIIMLVVSVTTFVVVVSIIASGMMP